MNKSPDEITSEYIEGLDAQGLRKMLWHLIKADIHTAVRVYQYVRTEGMK